MWCTKSAPGANGARASVARAARAGMLALCIGNPTNLASNCLYLHTAAGTYAVVVPDRSRPRTAQVTNLGLVLAPSCLRAPPEQYCVCIVLMDPRWRYFNCQEA